MGEFYQSQIFRMHSQQRLLYLLMLSINNSGQLTVTFVIITSVGIEFDFLDDVLY